MKLDELWPTLLTGEEVIVPLSTWGSTRISTRSECVIVSFHEQVDEDEEDVEP